MENKKVCGGFDHKIELQLPQRIISRDVLEWIAMLIKGDAINTYNDLQ